ncbi:MAG TPA: polyphosphate kinase 1 [Gaiellales bacterium]|nr:polyphosphate kinase 1 [Gaiellales bacterium]
MARAADKGAAGAGVAALATPRRRGGAARRPKPPPDRFLNRELSWLDWNDRCIQLGQDATVPLLHRIRLCSFISTGLDEFFMVRVAGLERQAASGLDVRSPDGRSPHATLDEIATRVREQVRKQSDLYEHDLLPALAEAGIRIGRVEAATRAGLRALGAHYEREIYPVLTPLAIGPGQPFPYISGLSLSLGVFVRDPATGEERLARVKVPEGMSRFITAGRERVMFPLEEVIAHFLPRLFPGMEVVESAPFRVTRDADFDVSDDADDLLEAVQVELRRRRFGDVVRLEVAHAMSQRMQRRLVDSLDVSDRQVFRIHGMLDLADVSQLADIDRPELKFEPWVGVVPPAFASGDRREMFQAIAENDVLIHLPYDSFAATVEEFINAGARDPDSVALKTTVYRTSERSPLIPALIRAAEEGKQSVCVVELKARFDESRNIHWSRALEEAGTHVAYGFPHLKVHAKTTLIVRREGRGLRRYAHIGTGNYHALTARVYEDFGLFTADDDITADVSDLFNLLTGFGRPQNFRKLLVSPYTLRPRLLELFAAVADAARAGRRARIRIKVNHFTDAELIDALYEASQAGAQVDIVARTVCALRPGVEGLSENIRVRSVLGRWLEHSRAFIIEAGDDSTYLIGSADLMPRNLDGRFEVLVPVEGETARRQLAEMFDALFGIADYSWQLLPDGSWARLPSDGTGGTQLALIRRARRSSTAPTAPR